MGNSHFDTPRMVFNTYHFLLVKIQLLISFPPALHLSQSLVLLLEVHIYQYLERQPCYNLHENNNKSH